MDHNWIVIIGGFVCFEIGAWYERWSSKRRQKKTLVRVYEAEYICEHRWCSFSVKGRQYAVDQVQRQHINWHIDMQERIERDSSFAKPAKSEPAKGLFQGQPMMSWDTVMKKGTDEATGPSTTSSQSGS